MEKFFKKLFLILVFSASFLIINFLSFFIFQHFPVTGDEYSYIFQAKIFKLGRLYVNSHPLMEFFDLHHVVNNGRMYSKSPPGTSIMLFLGELVNMPWIVNPLLGSLTLVIFYFIGKNLYDEKRAQYIVIFILLTPVFLIYSSTYFTELPSLFFLSLSLFYFIKSREGKNKNWIFSGLSWGMAFITRPLTSIAYLIPFLIFWFISFIKKKLAKGIFFWFIASMPFIFFFIFYNYSLTGNILTTPYFVYEKSCCFYCVCEPCDYNLILDMLWKNVISIPNMFYMPIVKYLFFVLFMLISIISIVKNKNFWEICLFIGFIIAIILHSFYINGPSSRFFYDPLILLFLPFVSGIFLVSDFIGRKMHLKSEKIQLVFLITYVILFIFALNHSLKIYINEIKIIKQPYDEIKHENISNAIVFIKSVPRWGPTFYTRNSPTFNDDIIFARDLNEKNKLLMKMYSNKSYYLYDYNSTIRLKELNLSQT